MARTALALILVLAVAAGALLACGGNSRRGSAFEELGRLTAIQGARPVLVFVYTDG